MSFYNRHFRGLLVLFFYVFFCWFYLKVIIENKSNETHCDFATPLFFLLYWLIRISITLIFISKSKRSEYKNEYYILALITNLIPYLF